MDTTNRKPLAARDQPPAPNAPVLSSYANDPDMAELVDLYVKELSNRISDLQECCTEQDWESVRRTAHQLKGASAGYGFASVGVTAGELEVRAAKAMQSRAKSDIERTIAQVQELVDLCGRVRSR